MASKIDGTALAKRIREGLRQTIEESKKANPRFRPCLKIIQGASVHVLCAVYLNPLHNG